VSTGWSVNPRLRRPAGTDGPARRTLLLHGMGGGAAGWDPVAPLLSQDLELWDTELPWATTGDPKWARDTDAASWVSTAIAQVEDTGGPVDLVVAHSFAANAVLELMDRAGGDWQRPVVLICPFYRPDAGDFDWNTMGYYVEGFHRMLDEGIQLRAGHRIDPATRERMADRLCDLMGPYTWLRFFDTYLHTPLLHPEDSDVPTLVLGGEHDHGAQPDGVRALVERIPQAVGGVLPDCGHFPMAERPEDLARIINQFSDLLDRLAGPPAPAGHPTASDPTDPSPLTDRLIDPLILEGQP
jgi:pimeloyl-ACP methyl ester carboxylesterase